VSCKGCWAAAASAAAAMLAAGPAASAGDAIKTKDDAISFARAMALPLLPCGCGNNYEQET